MVPVQEQLQLPPQLKHPQHLPLLSLLQHQNLLLLLSP
jgi:hypothetical protein